MSAIAGASRSGGDANSVAAPHATTPLSQVHDLLVSLLHWWPYAPHEQSPSVLLCGPATNGKSHLIRRVVHDANTVCRASTAESALQAHEQRRAAIAVVPHLAAAVAVQQAKDGCTGLRRLLRREVEAACAKATCVMTSSSKLSTNTTRDQSAELAVVVVLDHLECFLTHDDTYISGGGEEQSKGGGAVSAATRAGGDDAAAGAASVMEQLNTPYPELVADLYTVLRSAPPLFTPEECTALRLSTLVFVSLFTGDLDEVLPVVRQRYVDYALSLPTPSEAERRTFFHNFAAPPNTAVQGRLPAALVDALALRTGGVSYGGLQEIVALAMDSVQDDEEVKETNTDMGALTSINSCSPQESAAHDDARAATSAVAAQRLLHAYQSSGSVTAMEYRRSAGYVDVQTTRWDDIAGMAGVKATLRRLVTDPIRHRDAYRRFRVRPSTGVLLYGPPGTGKTMLAKAMATELNASFIYMDLPELVQSEVGESERRLQAYFDVARERSPSLVFMDEVQAAFGLRYATPTASATAGGVGKTARHGGAVTHGTTSHDARLIAHLLRLLDAAQQDEDHFVLFVGATNVVHLLDPLLLRAGRLDTLLEVPLPDAAARESLVRRVVYGEWSSWFAREGGSVADAGSAQQLQQQQQQLARVQRALVDEFVRLSDGFSGAQVRNLLSVFSLQLARTVSRNGTLTGAAEKTGLELDTPANALQRQQRLREGIARFLISEDSSGVLSAAAVALLMASHAKACA